MRKHPTPPAELPAELPAIAANPLQARKKKAPVCFQCRLKKAIHLSRMGGLRRFTVFCSLACAASFAIEAVLESPFTWCLKHKAWSNCYGRCNSCEQEKVLASATPPVLLGDLLDEVEGGNRG